MITYDVIDRSFKPLGDISFHDFLKELHEEARVRNRQIRGYFFDYNVVVDPNATSGDLLRLEESYNNQVKHISEIKTPDAKALDKELIMNLIDHAMEKKDRYVTLYFNDDSVSVNIYPLGEKEVNDNE